MSQSRQGALLTVQIKGFIHIIFFDGFPFAEKAKELAKTYARFHVNLQGKGVLSLSWFVEYLQSNYFG